MNAGTPDARPHLRVLLIEDNPGDARLIREMLRQVSERFAVELAVADHLATGLERLAAGQFDAVLLDLSLPDSRGLETFERMQAAAPSAPIVVLSGFDDENVAVRAVQLGAQDYLLKRHVNGHLLARAIRYAIERKRAAEERAEYLAREQVARADAERQAAEQAAILRQITDGVVIANAEGEVVFANTAAQRLLGAHAREAVQDALTGGTGGVLDASGALYEPGDLPLARAALHGETVVNADLCVRHPDGSQVVLQGSATPVTTEDGARLGAVLTLHDVTAQRDLERQKDEFFSNISHDLRTPVAAVKASIGVVLANEPPGLAAPLHRMLTNIDLAADEMGRLVDDLLELTRLRAGRVQLWLAENDLRDVVTRCARAIEPLAETRDQRIELDLPREPVLCVVDAERLGRALLNLFGNAHKYGRDGGYIRAGIRRCDDEVCISVSDNGPGIPAAEHARIFERFYREKSGATRSTKGSGLGLPIARALVELHGGRVWVESTPGVGSTFHVALPTASEHDSTRE